LASSPDWSILDDIALHIFYTGLDMDSAEDVDIATRGSFAHKTLIERKKILDHILGNSSFLTYPYKPQKETKSHHESPSSAESNPLPSTSHDSSVEPSAVSQTSKEEESQPSKFSFPFEDDPYENLRNTLNHLCERRPMAPSSPPNKAFLKEEWSEEVRRYFEVIQISSPSTTICCSIRRSAIEALQNPTAKACIMSEFLTDTFIGRMPLVLTDRLFKSPLGLIFECRGIARAVSIKIDKIKVQLDFHIYPILNFDLLIGQPLEKFLEKKSSQWSLNNEFKKTAFTTPISYPEIPMAKHHPGHDLLVEVKFISPFVSPKCIFILMKQNVLHQPYSSLSLVPLAHPFTMNLLRRRTIVLRALPRL
jgi:hypothetical protein